MDINALGQLFAALEQGRVIDPRFIGRAIQVVQRFQQQLPGTDDEQTFLVWLKRSRVLAQDFNIEGFLDQIHGGLTVRVPDQDQGTAPFKQILLPHQGQQVRPASGTWSAAPSPGSGQWGAQPNTNAAQAFGTQQLAGSGTRRDLTQSSSGTRRDLTQSASADQATIFEATQAIDSLIDFLAFNEFVQVPDEVYQAIKAELQQQQFTDERSLVMAALQKLVQRGYLPAGSIQINSRLQRWQDCRAVEEQKRQAASQPQVLAGRYELRQELGRGGMGVVYAAWDRQLLRRVCVKEQLAGDQQEFLAEALMTAKFSYGGLLSIYDVIQTPEELHIVLQYVQGNTLQRVISEMRSMDKQRSARGLGQSLRQSITLAEAPESNIPPLETRLDWCVQIADSVGVMHGAGILHRDLKPLNIMIDEHGAAITLDFGLAQTETVLRNPEGDMIHGTPLYMSPEQTFNDPLDARSDVYALGVIMFQLLTGRNPHLLPEESDGHFGGNIIGALERNAMVSEQKEPLPHVLKELGKAGLPKRVVEVIYTALMPQPSSRYNDGATLAAALREARLEVLKRQARQRLIIKAAVLGLILAMVGTGLLWRSASAEARAKAEAAESERLRADAQAEAAEEANLKAEAERKARTLAERLADQAQADASVERLIVGVQALIDNSDWPKAEEELRKVLEVNSQHRHARWLLGKVLFYQFKAESAEQFKQLVDQLAQAQTDEERDERYRAMFWVTFTSKLFAVSEFKENPESYNKYREENRHELFRFLVNIILTNEFMPDELAAMRTKYPQNALIHFMAGLRYWTMGTEMERQMNALRANGDIANANRALGAAITNYVEAIKCYNSARFYDVNMAIAYRNEALSRLSLAQLRVISGDLAQAEFEYSLAIEISAQATLRAPKWGWAIRQVVLGFLGLANIYKDRPGGEALCLAVLDQAVAKLDTYPSWVNHRIGEVDVAVHRAEALAIRASVLRKDQAQVQEARRYWDEANTLLEQNSAAEAGKLRQIRAVLGQRP